MRLFSLRVFEERRLSGYRGSFPCTDVGECLVLLFNIEPHVYIDI